MKRTGIKATEEEIDTLKAAASTSGMMIGGVPPRDPAKLAHEIALRHGLPEIPGFYGIDLATGEFLAADNAPLPEGLADKVQPSRREIAEKVLGKAVHPDALTRLLELWPEAQVEVRHDRTWRGVLFTGKRVQLRRTTVEIWEGEKNPIPLPEDQRPNHRHVTREAVCHSGDTFQRREGIRIAFERCLREVTNRSGAGL